MIVHLDADDVREALTVERVLTHYGWQVRRSGRDLESRACPLRSDHSRRALVVTPSNGLWKCHACDVGGDMFDFVASCERLQIDTDFATVLARAAEIAGVVPSSISDEERARRREEHRARRAAQEAHDAEERRLRAAAAVPTATSYWADLLPRDERGVRYLCERGIGDALAFSDAIRFDGRCAGSPAIPLFTRDGQIRNVVRRRLPELGEPKTPGLSGCPTAGTFVNSVRDAVHMPDRDVVIAEGVFDSLTAAIAWRSAIVLGAHGAANVPTIARLIAPVIAKTNRRLLIVPHRDKRGYFAALEACEHAHRAGLSVRSGSLCIVKHDRKDLNDAWRDGWRPTA